MIQVGMSLYLAKIALENDIKEYYKLCADHIETMINFKGARADRPEPAVIGPRQVSSRTEASSGYSTSHLRWI